MSRVLAVLPSSEDPSAASAVMGFAAAHDLHVVSTANASQSIVDAAKKARATVVLAQQWSDYGMGPGPVHILLHDLERLGVEAMVVEHNLNTTTPEGRLQRGLAIAQAFGPLDAPSDVGQVIASHATELAVPAMARALGYIRVSQAREEMISPELQERHIVEHCQRQGYVYIGSVADLDLSGRSFRHREQIKEATALVAAGEVDVIVVWKWSRFGRNVRESYINLGLIENDLGGRVESATEAFDTKTSIGNFQRGFFLQLAEFESDRAGELWRDVHARRLRMGLPHTGGPRLGYVVTRDSGESRYEPEWVRPDGSPGAATAVATCYRDYVDGAGFATLARKLNEQGLRTTRGGPFGSASVRASMDSGFAAGLLPTGREYGVDKQFRRGRHEPLIDAETWERYCRERRRRRPQRPRRPAVSPLLSGLVRCPYCGGRMTAGQTMYETRNGQREFRFYACGANRSGKSCSGTSMGMDQLDSFVRTWVTAWLREGGREALEREQRRLLEAGVVAEQRLAEPSVDSAKVVVADDHDATDGETESVAELEPRRLQLWRDRKALATRATAIAAAVEAADLLGAVDPATEASGGDLRALISAIYVRRGRPGVKTVSGERVTVVPIALHDDVAGGFAVETPIPPAPGPPPAGATRAQLLDLASASCPLTAEELAAALGLTAMAVRRHCVQLVAQRELFIVGMRSSGRGRPARLYSRRAGAPVELEPPAVS